MTKYASKKQGFALLMGVLIAAILISITYTMFGISLKQLTLSTAGKNSQMAFYAADTGLECALFADTKIDQAFANFTTSVDGSGNTFITFAGTQSTHTLNCNGQAVPYTPALDTITVGGSTYSSVESTITVNSHNYPTVPSCAIIKVTKYKVTQTTGGRNIDTLKTKIESRGYNTCTSDSDPQKLERGLEINY